MKTGLVLVALLSLGACQKSQDSMDKAFAEQEAEAAKAVAANVAFLSNIAKEPGVVTLPSGLMYKVVSSPNPTAPQPTAEDTVTVNYEGKLVDGTIFDSSYKRNQPATFPLGRVVEAWQIGIPLMHTGDTYMLYVPAKLGYGERDMGEIPPNSTLVFKVQLLGIQGKANTADNTADNDADSPDDSTIVVVTSTPAKPVLLSSDLNPTIAPEI